MMLRGLVLVAALACPHTAFAEAEPLGPFSPEVGSRWATEDVNASEKSMADGSRQKQTITSKGELVFKEKTERGWRVVYTTKSIDVTGDAPEVAIAGPALKVMEGVTVVGETDKRGRPVRIDNLEEAQGRMKEAADRIAERFAGQPKIQATIRSLFGSILAQGGSQAAELYLEPLTQTWRAHGLTLKDSEVKKESIDKPNPFGGTIASMITTRLEPSFAAAGEAVVVVRETYDPESTRAAIRALGQRVLASAGSEAKAITPDQLEKFMTLAELKLEREGFHRLRKGMTRSLDETSVTRVSMMGQAVEKVERRRLTLTPAP